MSVLIAEKSARGLEAALLKDGKLYAYIGAEDPFGPREGQIYAAVTDRAAKGISSVFVRLPGGQAGFLPMTFGQKCPPSGNRVLVQIKRPPVGQKKALLTRDITLAGTRLVFLPLGSGVRVSSRVQDASEKAALIEKGKAIQPRCGGIILRSAAVNAPVAQLADELQGLEKKWQRIQSAFQQTSGAALLQDGDGPVEKLIAQENDRLESILTNAPESLPHDVSCPVRVCEQPMLLHNVRAKLEKSLRRTVLLKSGATLVIDPCEAMTVIDVNSAMAAGGKDIARTAEKINTEAVGEIARLLRLRGIGGMILIDFIDMDSDEARERLLAAMREALLHDPVKTTVHDITPLGIMEITRHREQPPLSPLADPPCPHCGGTGVSLSVNEEETLHA